MKVVLAEQDIHGLLVSLRKKGTFAELFVLLKTSFTKILNDNPEVKKEIELIAEKESFKQKDSFLLIILFFTPYITYF